MRGSNRVAHLPGCSEGIGSVKRHHENGEASSDICSASSDTCFSSCSGPCLGPGLCFGLAAAAAAGPPAPGGVTPFSETSWWSRSQNSRKIFTSPLTSKDELFDTESAQSWQFFGGSLEDLQAPPGFVWLVMPAAFPVAAPELAPTFASASCRALPPCPRGLPPPVLVGRAGVLADVAVEKVGRTCFVSEPFVEPVSPGIWRDSAVLFCAPSLALCWLWSELGLSKPDDADGFFDVDELCLIAMETRLAQESGFDLRNSATFGESLSL
jgi:hypothetical protein